MFFQPREKDCGILYQRTEEKNYLERESEHD